MVVDFEADFGWKAEEGGRIGGAEQANVSRGETGVHELANLWSLTAMGTCFDRSGMVPKSFDGFQTGNIMGSRTIGSGHGQRKYRHRSTPSLLIKWEPNILYRGCHSGTPTLSL